MNIDLTELMKSSKDSLEGKWGLAIGTFLVFILISTGLQLSAEKYPMSGFITLLISGPFGVGLSGFALKLSRNEEARFEDSFAGFSNFLNSFLAYLLILIIVAGGIILFIIPGIIAAMALSMTYIILSEDPNISALDALKKSHKMMDGYKMKYFFLSLRFFGLGLLCILTLGIGFFWLMPYMYVTNAKFYDQIKDVHTIEIID
ncbi:DUF975 family protein [Flavicella marina]|uniref:DUF975 family protein n=1 Tax=Flavicella marina TaxID=1475951 RepID=UPI0012654C67|nr:DUF975 family protein [Flavicella marina]